MKILFFPLIRQDHIHSNQAGDYQADSLFHGLRTLLGNDVVDLYKMWHLYNDADPESLKTLWGKGFTTCGLLPDTGDIDRDDIEYKVMNLDYDYIVVSIHHTVNGNYPVIGAALETFRSFYPKNRIILVDGWDRSDLNENIAKECIYFKREMLSKHKNLVQPISFSIPEEKIQDPLEKTFDFAPLIPRISLPDKSLHEETYIYEDEDSYYDDYRKSFFAYTCKKGRDDIPTEGWDCMRHYEILACGCVPFFTDIEKCPEYILRRFPTSMCSDAKRISGVYPGTKSTYDPKVSTYIGTAKEILGGDERGYIDFDKFDRTMYNDINEKLTTYTKSALTTVATAKNFLKRVEEWASR